jgi:hypothetical protein
LLKWIRTEERNNLDLLAATVGDDSVTVADVVVVAAVDGDTGRRQDLAFRSKGYSLPEVEVELARVGESRKSLDSKLKEGTARNEKKDYWQSRLEVALRYRCQRCRRNVKVYLPRMIPKLLHHRQRPRTEAAKVDEEKCSRIRRPKLVVSLERESSSCSIQPVEHL